MEVRKATIKLNRTGKYRKANKKKCLYIKEEFVLNGNGIK